jgi:uncharacterized membrane protein
VKRFYEFIVRNFLAGFVALLPIYLATLLVLKAVKSLRGVLRPLAALLPGWFPTAVSFILVLTLCLLVGMALRTPTGQTARAAIEKTLLQKIPGYILFRGMTRQLAGEGRESAWKPALAEIEDALVPAFIIEEFDDGRFTVFVPSVPTPFAGAVYILTADRVHPLNVPFRSAVKAVAQWGSGSRELVAAMEAKTAPSTEKNRRLG